MKATIEQTPQPFQPIELRITLESEAEFNALYQIVNESPYRLTKLLNEKKLYVKEDDISSLTLPIFNLLRPLKP